MDLNILSQLKGKTIKHITKDEDDAIVITTTNNEVFDISIAEGFNGIPYFVIEILPF